MLRKSAIAGVQNKAFQLTAPEVVSRGWRVAAAADFGVSCRGRGWWLRAQVLPGWALQLNAVVMGTRACTEPGWHLPIHLEMATYSPDHMNVSNDNTRVLRGIVRSGLGDCGRWIARLQEEYRAKTGMTLYPGTLNLELSEAFSVPEGALRLEGQEYGGTVSISIVECRVFGRRAFILRTDANELGTGDHPRTIIEIATDVKLRDEHELSDGDLVDVVLHCRASGP